MHTIRLPRVAVSRDLAAQLAHPAQPGQPVTIDGRGLITSNAPFAQELAANLAALQPAAAITMLGGSPDWQAQWQAAAAAQCLRYDVRPLHTA